LAARKDLGTCSIGTPQLYWTVARDPASVAGHSEEVTAVATSADGEHVLSASKDKTLRAWDMNTGQQRWKLEMPSAITALAISSDTRTVVTGGRDGAVRICDVPSRRMLREAHIDDVITGVAFRRHDQEILLDGLSSGVLTEWDDKEIAVTTRPTTFGPGKLLLLQTDNAQILTSKSIAFPLHKLRGVAYHPDWGWLCGGGDGVLNAGGTLWKTAAAGREAERVLDLPHFINCVALAANGRLAAFGTANGGVYVLSDGKEPQPMPRQHDGSVESIDFSPNGQLVATGSVDGTVRLWNADERKQVLVLRGHTAPVRTVAFARHAGVLVSGGADGSLWAWKVGDYSHLVLRGHKRNVSAVEFLANDTLISTSWDNSLRLWDVKAGRARGAFGLRNHVITRHQFSLSRDRKKLATVHALEPAINLWNLETRDPPTSIAIAPFFGGTLALAPDGTVVAYGTTHGKVKIWNATTKQQLHEMEFKDAELWASSFSPHGEILAFAATDGRLFICDPVGGKLIDTLSFNNERIQDFAFNPADDGQTLAVAIEHGPVRLLTRHNHLERLRIDFPSFAVAFHPSGRWLALAGNSSNASVEDVRVWDLLTRAEVARPGGPTYKMQGVAFSPDGTLLAAGSYDTNIYIWRLDWLFRSLTDPGSSLLKEAENAIGLRIARTNDGPTVGSDRFEIVTVKSGLRVKVLTSER
jgi:WD40 repeat protein